MKIGKIVAIIVTLVVIFSMTSLVVYACDDVNCTKYDTSNYTILTSDDITHDIIIYLFSLLPYYYFEDGVIIRMEGSNLHLLEDVEVSPFVSFLSSIPYDYLREGVLVKINICETDIMEANLPIIPFNNCCPGPNRNWVLVDVAHMLHRDTWVCLRIIRIYRVNCYICGDTGMETRELSGCGTY